MSYTQFKDRWIIPSQELSSLDYVNIKMAIRRYNCPSTNNKNVKFIDSEISLSFLGSPPITSGNVNDVRKVKSKDIRDKMISRSNPGTLPPMMQWNGELNRNVDWIQTFSNLFYSLTNNFKLIQFHYKLWHRISTCRYMRHKMKIDPDSPVCSLCNEELETLQHIFLNCKFTGEFLEKVNNFITSKVDCNYRDTDRYYLLTLNHADQRVNRINAAANWFISKKFQNKSQLNFAIFLNELKTGLLGEKSDINNSLRNIFSP